MANARALLVASLSCLGGAVVLGIAGTLPWPDGWAPRWGNAHVVLSVFGFLMPGLAFLHWQVAGRRMPRGLGDPGPIAIAWTLGAVTLALTGLWDHVAVQVMGTVLGWLCLVAAASLQAAAVLRASPRRGESVVDVAKDPLTKGDDASLKHVKLAHMLFLPLAVLGLAVASLWSLWGEPPTATDRLRLASFHWLLAGYALLSIYGLSHIAVPRLCGVPAIAAGAVKGELHSSLLGLVLLAAGFLMPAGPGATALLVAGGAFLFLGAFVFMGVLGANIMKNKSPTQRVTPEFAYVPWTFAGVFWLITGVLLGLFLNAAKAQVDSGAFSTQVAAGLAFIHVHAALLGGFGMLLLGYATRILPAARGQPPAPFARTKWGFYALNVGLITMFYGNLAGGTGSTAFLAGSLLSAAGLAAWFISLLPSLRSPGART